MTASAQGEDRSNFQDIGPWKDLYFGWCKATEGLTFTDPAFSANWDNLRTQVRYRGAYHFFHPGLDPTAQAEFFMGTVISRGLEPGDMLAIDAEISAGLDGTQILPYHGFRSHLLRHGDNGTARIHPGARGAVPCRLFRRSLPRKITAALVGSAARQFLDEVTRIADAHVGGDYCPVYCYSFVAFLPQLAPCRAYPLWAADFAPAAPSSVAPWKTWTQWQYAGGGGQLGADQDAFNGTPSGMDDWMRTYQPGTRPQPAPPPQPAPDWTETLMTELPVLQAGAAGQDVQTVQGLLCARGHAVTIDGIFGPATRSAVQNIQGAKGLAADGIVGPATWPALLNR